MSGETMPEHLVSLSLGIRDVIGAWIVCFVFAAGCFTWLAAAAPGHGDGAEGLISFDPAATVVVARAEPHGRC